jgi:hypothetical protein
MPRENPEGNLPFKLRIDVRPCGKAPDKSAASAILKVRPWGEVPVDIARSFLFFVVKTDPRPPADNSVLPWVIVGNGRVGKNNVVGTSARSPAPIYILANYLDNNNKHIIHPNKEK